MGKYPEIVPQLINAAKDRGLFSGSQIFALADGAIGLSEALEGAFPGLQFIARSRSWRGTALRARRCAPSEALRGRLACICDF